MKAAYIPVGMGGHILASLPMITELVKKGVRVDYYAPESYCEQVELTGAVLCPFPEVTECYSRGYLADEDFLAVIPLIFLGQAKEAVGAIEAQMKDNLPDVIIVDQLAIAGRLLAKKYHIPMVMFHPTYAANEHFSISRFWPKYSDNSPARTAARKMAAEFAAEYGVDDLNMAGIFEGHGDYNIVTLTKSFHPAGETFGDDYFFAGAQIAPREGDGSWKAPDNGKPLLYTSLGSLFNNWPEFYRMLFPVVKDLDINVLCSIGKTLTPDDLGEIPSNVTTMAFTPQLEVLSKTDFFLTHAGTGSVMEALYFGVPCMCIPQMDEQVFTAGRAKDLGIASAVLKKEEVTEETLRNALKDLISDPQYKANAKAMSQEMRQNGGCERAAQAVIDFINQK